MTLFCILFYLEYSSLTMMCAQVTLIVSIAIVIFRQNAHNEKWNSTKNKWNLNDTMQNHKQDEHEHRIMCVCVFVCMHRYDMAANILMLLHVVYDMFRHWWENWRIIDMNKEIILWRVYLLACSCTHTYIHIHERGKTISTENKIWSN